MWARRSGNLSRRILGVLHVVLDWGIIINCEAVGVGTLRQDPSTCVIRQGHDYKRRPGCEERATVRSQNESTVQTPSPVSSAAVFGRGVFGARAKKETFAFGEI